MGIGNMGSCCAEMDIWEANSMATVTSSDRGLGCGKGTEPNPTVWQQLIRITLVIWATLVKSLRNTVVPGLSVVTITKGNATNAYVIKMVVT